MHKLNSRYGSRYSRYLMAATLLAVLVIGGTLMSSRPVVAQNPQPGSAPVSIVAPLPLPVTGSIGIPGTVKVRDVDHLVQTPFQATLNTLAGNPFSFVVPSDKRLAIEFVTGDCTSDLSSNSTFFLLGITTSGTSARHMFSPKLLLNLGLYAYGSADVTRLYADPGSTVAIASRPIGSVRSGLRAIFWKAARIGGDDGLGQAARCLQLDGGQEKPSWSKARQTAGSVAECKDCFIAAVQSMAAQR